tara:strand:+ start:1736 stop:1921 length:186 start_codon:yes stop_codon:yes gene_type:complete
MKKEFLLIDCTIKAVIERLETTLTNMQFQKGFMLWDDEEKIENCIEALKIIENEQKNINLK